MVNANTSLCFTVSWVSADFSENEFLWEGVDFEPQTSYRKDTEVEQAGFDGEGGNCAN